SRPGPAPGSSTTSSSRSSRPPCACARAAKRRSARVPKKKHDDHDEHVNHEAWVIPYADLLTLLMALFLVLWAMGQTDVAKAKAISAGFAEALGIGPEGGAVGGGGAGNSTYAGTGITVPQGSNATKADPAPNSD